MHLDRRVDLAPSRAPAGRWRCRAGSRARSPAGAARVSPTASGAARATAATTATEVNEAPWAAVARLPLPLRPRRRPPCNAAPAADDRGAWLLPDRAVRATCSARRRDLVAVALWAPTTSSGCSTTSRPPSASRRSRSVRQGRLYDLGRVLDEHVPVFPGRAFHQTLVTTAHHANRWAAIRRWASAEPRELDHRGHLRHDADRHAPGRAQPPPDRRPRLQRLARRRDRVARRRHPPRRRDGAADRDAGLLVDVPRRRGVARLAPGDVIEPADLDGIDPGPGDAVLFHTGWGAHWDDAAGVPRRRARAGPGGRRVARGARRALTGCDTWSYGPVPAEDPERPFEVPQLLNVRHGVFIVENLDMSALRRMACASSPSSSRTRSCAAHGRLDVPGRPRVTCRPGGVPFTPPGDPLGRRPRAAACAAAGTAGLHRRPPNGRRQRSRAPRRTRAPPGSAR